MTKILIVEDEITLQDVYKLILTHYGYEVSTANNGLDGLKMLKIVKPDLILLDIFMPVMDGREFLRNYNKTLYPNTKIIVYTNLSDNNTRAEMLELGADDFVLKASVGPAELIKLVEKTTTG